MAIPTTQKAIRIHETGGPEVVKLEEIPVPEITETQVLVKNEYAGVNFIETYFRKGIYKAQLPVTLGREGAGEVVKVGSKVSNYSVGDKVGFVGSAFAEYVAIEAVGKALKITKIPKGLDTKTVGAGLIQGLTALVLTTQSVALKKGDSVLVHAAAGGTGALIVQLAKAFGATVIGTTSSAEKAKIAKAAGADHVINYRTEDVTARVKEITNGAGVTGTLDGVGKDTFNISIASTANSGTVASFGNASGVVPEFSLLSLERNIKVQRPSLFNALTTTEDWEALTKQFFDLLLSGDLKLDISKVYPLAETSQAISDLESGKTTGKLVIQI
ncbi:Zta1p [Sugiyamaella lignohabitans]|uniref:Probable quinone oxidoreductase n=1 Tax=Sugiyamaella lignohabitans TaxID=796027 RepID=A0A167EY42_9ASCO|nr:Zta1p [Sugiyamaella lignohabitans]ANB14596.1 Zta1p [Sugiyamaella lignohabitans]